jgi:cobalamin biosynthesis protein CobT
MSAVAMSEMKRDPNYTSFAREEALYLPVLKGFDERINGNVKKRFAGVANYRIPFACQNNVDGESIQVAAYRLAQRPEKRKVMIVLSDGMPAANCPAYYRSGGDILSEHLKAVVQEVQKAKIDVVGIGINSFAVQKFYPKSVVLTRIDQLPIEVMRQLKALLVQ